jgi:hypothetical protein
MLSQDRRHLERIAADLAEVCREWLNVMGDPCRLLEVQDMARRAIRALDEYRKAVRP